jgi:hypothetical protein
MSVEGQLDFTNGRAFLCRNHPVAMNHLPYSNESRLFGARQIGGYLQFFLCLLFPHGFLGMLLLVKVQEHKWSKKANTI